MPGGVDIHSHIVGAKVNAGRKLRPEDHRHNVRERTDLTRSGSGYTVPTTYLMGYRYAEMGYTTVMEAATAPLVARHTHEELVDTPILDKGVFITMGNNHFIMKCIRDGKLEQARDYVAWLLGASKGYAIKIVNPGGVENWKWGRNVTELDDEVIGFGINPREIVTTLAWINEKLNLPHVPHVHGINLGRSFSARTTMETIEGLEGRAAHFCHLQFFSYGKQKGKLHRSAAAELARAVNENSNVTVDVGQIIFGEATTMTSDGPLQHRLHRETGNKWMNEDIENETGGGIVPVRFKRNNPINAVMWRTGLELFLLIDDPWQVFLTTDHPNGGPFFCYPHVIKLLMDRDFRAQAFDRIHRRGRKNALLPELAREYSLYEIAIITRAGPARALGLKNKGHLGLGADADITIYANLEDKEEMFARPKFVIKDGVVVARDGRIVCERPGRTLYVAPPYDPKIEEEIRAHFQASYTVSFDNYAISPDHLAFGEMVPCE
jgi:formylmethanofuran dehydrogenase subunit A